MQIHDLHAHIKRPLADCEIAEHANGFIPIKSSKDDQWFVVCMLSGVSSKLEDLSKGDLASVRESIATHRFTKLLLDRCHQVHDSQTPVARGPAILARCALALQYGDRPVESAERTARESGFTDTTLARAYVLLDTEAPLSDTPVTRISDLQQEADE